MDLKDEYINRYKQMLREYLCCNTGAESKMCKGEQLREAEYVLENIFNVDYKPIHKQIYWEASDNKWKYGYWEK